MAKRDLYNNDNNFEHKAGSSPHANADYWQTGRKSHLIELKEM